MTFVINKNDMFELLQSENFIIGKDLLTRSKSLIEKITSKNLKNFSVERITVLSSIFTALRNKWRLLKGGRQRLNFSKKNLKENIILKIEELEFELDNSETINEMACEVPLKEIIDQKSKTNCQHNLVSLKKRTFTRSSIRIWRKMQREIQNHLAKSNNFLKKYGVCFSSIEIQDSSLHTYNNTFKISKQIREKIFAYKKCQKQI